MLRSFFSNELTRLFLFILTCLVLAAILTPPIFEWGKAFASENANKDLPSWLESARKSTERADFARFYNRVLMAVAIVLLYPFIRTFKTQTQANRAPLLSRLNPGTQGWKDLLTGFIFAAGYMCIFIYLTTVLGWSNPKEKIEIGSMLTSAATTAIIVSLLEEWLFRGVLFTMLVRSLSPFKAILGSAIFYAAVHFLKPSKFSTPIEDPTAADAGFILLSQIFEKFIHPSEFLGVFITLVAVGIVLAYAYYQSGKLWHSIGLHAGWVFCLKCYMDALKTTGNAPAVMFGKDVREGLAPLCFILLTSLTCYFYFKRYKHPISIPYNSQQ